MFRIRHFCVGRPCPMDLPPRRSDWAQRRRLGSMEADQLFLPQPARRAGRMARRHLNFHFTIWQLLVVITATCVLLALLVWSLFWGPIIASGLTALVLVVLGIRTRRRSPLLGALVPLALGGGLFCCCRAASVIAWQASAKFDVYILVLDTDTFEPVSGATIEVFSGPWFPLEGPASPRLLSQFAPAPMEPGSGELLTDSRGRCNFAHRFYATGQDGLLRRAGCIHTGRYWLKTSAPGRGSVLIPLDGQGYPRDIDDRRPLSVTVPLRKQGVTETAATKPVP